MKAEWVWQGCPTLLCLLCQLTHWLEFIILPLLMLDELNIQHSTLNIKKIAFNIKKIWFSGLGKTFMGCLYYWKNLKTAWFGPKTALIMPVHTPPFSKGLVLHFKRAPFTLQKDSFYDLKGLVLHFKRTPFATQKDYIFSATEFRAKTNRRMMGCQRHKQGKPTERYE